MYSIKMRFVLFQLSSLLFASASQIPDGFELAIENMDTDFVRIESKQIRVSSSGARHDND